MRRANRAAATADGGRAREEKARARPMGGKDVEVEVEATARLGVDRFSL